MNWIGDFLLGLFILISLSFIICRIFFRMYFETKGLNPNPDGSKQFITIIGVADYYLERSPVDLTTGQIRTIRIIKTWEILNLVLLILFLFLSIFLTIYAAENHPGKIANHVALHIARE